MKAYFTRSNFSRRIYIRKISLCLSCCTRALHENGLWREVCIGASLEPPDRRIFPQSTLHPYARSCHNSTKTNIHKAISHGHRQVHRRRLPRRSGRQRRHSSRSAAAAAPPALLRRNCRLRAQLASYRSREFYFAGKVARQLGQSM